jgi:hypothetical protein
MVPVTAVPETPPTLPLIPLSALSALKVVSPMIAARLAPEPIVKLPVVSDVTLDPLITAVLSKTTAIARDS